MRGPENGTGWTIRSWRDVTTVFSLIGVLLSAVGLAFTAYHWLDALQLSQVRQDERLQRLEAEIDKGVLPRTDERLHAIEQRLDVVQAENLHALQMLERK